MILISGLVYSMFKKILTIRIVFCNSLSLRIYKAVKFCEKLSGKSKEIEKAQKKIQKEVENAKRVEQELNQVQEVFLTKDEQIKRLLTFIKYISINFRSKNYDEVDRLLKEINL